MGAAAGVLGPGRSRAGREVGGGGADQVLSAGTGGSGLAAVTVVGGGRGGLTSRDKVVARISKSGLFKSINTLACGSTNLLLPWLAGSIDTSTEVLQHQ